MLCRVAFAALVWILCAAQFCMAGATGLVMAPLARGQAVVALVLTEDGKYLVAASKDASLVTVWDVRTGAEAKRIAIEAPNLLLCRGDILYVASGAALCGYSEAAGWAQIGRVVLPEPAVSLSAGWGAGFRQEILAVIGKDRAVRRVMDVDVKAWAARPLGEPREIDAAAVSRDGLTLLFQDHVGQTPGGIPQAYALADYKRGAAAAAPLGKSEYGSYAFLYQTANSDVWFGQSEAYGGTPPKRFWLEGNGSIVVPDAARPVAYSLRADGIAALDVAGGMTPAGTAPATFQSTKPMATYNAWSWGVFPRGAAVTLGNELYVFFYYDADQTIYRGQMAAFALPAGRAGGNGSATPPAFESLPSSEPVDSVAVTEDSRFLVAAHHNVNLITVWDVQMGREAARQNCPAPAFVLCRGSRAYVASADNGTIRIFRQNDGWKLEDEVQVGAPGVYYLSAPGGEHFDGHVLATCHTARGDQRFLVDCKRDARLQAKGVAGWAATLSYSGRKVIAQSVGSGGAPDVYDLDAFMSGDRPDPRLPFAPNGYPYLFQVREGDAWFGGRCMYADLSRPPAPLGVVAVPDRTRDVVYAIGRGTLTAWRANAALAPLGSCAAQTPSFLANFAAEAETGGRSRDAGWRRRRLGSWQGYVSRPGRDGFEVVAEPIAVTLGGTVYLVLHDPSSGAVYRCAVRASAFSVAPPVAGTGATTTPPASSPASLAKVPTEQAVTTMALTEDGQFLLAAHEPANQISVWDVRRGVCAVTLSCPSPRSILCRGGRAYVANYGQGTITVLDPAKNWAAVTRCEVGDPDVFYLSAPQGKFFTNQVLATCGKYKHRAVVLVDVASGARSARLADRDNLGAATVDYRGSAVVEQREFDWQTMGYPQAFDYAVYLRGGAVPVGPALEQRMGLLAQGSAGPVWFDDSQVAAGLPPATILRPGNYPFEKAGLIVPDLSRPVFYRLESDGVHVRAADESLVEQGRITAELPDWACRPSPRLAGESYPDIRVLPPDLFANPAAVTLDGRVYLFAVHDGALYRFTGPAPVAVPPRPATAGSPPIRQPAAPATGQPVRLNLAAEPTFLARTRDGSALLLLEGGSLSLLDREGRAVTRTATLPALYTKLLDRGDYYVALAGNAVDLLDRRTLAVTRHVEFGGPGGTGGTRDLALHPTEPRCYVSVADGEAPLTGGADFELPRVVEVDERTGAVRYLRHVYGERLFVDVTGRQLAALTNMHFASVELAWELGALGPFVARRAPLSRPRLFAVYRLDPGQPAQCVAVAENRGPDMTPDGNAVVTPGSGLLTEHALGDLQKPSGVYHASMRASASATAYDYHPRLGIVAVADDAGVTLYDRSTGRPRAGGTVAVRGVERIVFAPSGRSLCIVSHETGASQHVLASYPVALTAEEERVVAAAAPPEFKRLEVDRTVPELPSGTVEPRQIQSLTPPPRAAPMTAKQINQRYLRSVVLVGRGQPTFTGIAVGRSGYVITCAEAISPDSGNKLFVRTPTPQPQPYATVGDVEVIRVDAERNLALVKVPTVFDTVVPLAATAPDAGEAVTLMANGGGDFNGIWGVSVLTGTVSSPSETMHGVTYLQTTVAGGGGALGAPLFDGKGTLIGLMARRTRKEGVSFAIRVADVREFLKACVGPPTTKPAEPAVPKPRQKSGGEIAEENRLHATRGPTVQGPAADIPRPAPAAGSPAIATTETVWEKQVTGGTFFTSPDGQHVGWVQIDPRRIGQPGTLAEQGMLDGVRRPFGARVYYSDDSKNSLYFLSGAAAGRRDEPLRYVLNGASPRAAVAGPANQRPVDIAPGGRHVGWISVKEGRWTGFAEFAVIDGVAGKEYQRILCEPSFSAEGAHWALVASALNRAFVVRDGKESACDGQVETAVAVAGHVAVVLRQQNERHVEYDGQPQKPYQRISNLRISPDGKHVGYIASMLARNFLVIDGDEKDVPVSPVESLTFGPGGHWACLGGKNNAQLVLDGVPQGPTDVQSAGRPSITFSPDGLHVAYVVERHEPGTKPYAGGAPVPVQRRYVVLDGRVQPLPDDDSNTTDRLTFSPDARRFAYIVQAMRRPTPGPDGQPPVGYDAVPRPVQRLVVDGVATDTFAEIRPPVFSPKGKHYGCLAVRKGHDPVGRDDQWYIVLDGAAAPCRRPISQVPFFDAHDILRAYTASPDQGPWHLTDVYRLEARSK